MAEIPFQVGIEIGLQNAEGDLNSVVSGATSIAELAAGGGDPAAGGVLGDPGSGVGESGVDITFTRDDKARAVVAGSFTQQQGEFLREAIESFTVSWVLKGSGFVSPTVDANYKLPPGVDALLEAMGLVGAAWASGVGYRYAPGSAKSLTAKVWIGPYAWVLQDCSVSGKIEFTPAGLAVVTSTIEPGSVASFSSPGFPGTVNYGTLASLSAPVIQGVAHAWSTTRGFNSLTLDFSNSIEELEDSNALTGKRKRATGREITADLTIWADDASAFEHTNLVATTAPTTQEIFTAGTPGANPANAFTVALTNPQALSMKPAKLQDRLGWEMKLKAVDDTANGEFELVMK